MALARAPTAEMSLLVRFPWLDFAEGSRGMGIRKHIKTWNIDSLNLEEFEEGWYSPNRYFWEDITPDAVEPLLSFWFDICELVLLKMNGSQTLAELREETMDEAAKLSRDYLIAKNMEALYHYVDDHPKCSLVKKVHLVKFPNGYGEVEKTRARQLLCETVRKTLSEKMIFTIVNMIRHCCEQFTLQNVDKKPASIKPGEWNTRYKFRPESYFNPFGNSQNAFTGLQKAVVVILLDHCYRGSVSVPYQDSLGHPGSDAHWGLLYKTLSSTCNCSPDGRYPKILGYFYRSVRLAAQLEAVPERDIRLVKSRSSDVQNLMAIARDARDYYGIS